MLNQNSVLASALLATLSAYTPVVALAGGAPTIPRTDTVPPIEFAPAIGKPIATCNPYKVCLVAFIDSVIPLAITDAGNCTNCNLPFGELYQVLERVTIFNGPKAKTTFAESLYVFCSKTSPQAWYYLQPTTRDKGGWVHHFIRPANADLDSSEFGITQTYLASCHRLPVDQQDIATANLIRLAHEFGYKEMPENDGMHDKYRTPFHLLEDIITPGN